MLSEISIDILLKILVVDKLCSAEICGIKTRKIKDIFEEHLKKYFLNLAQKK